MTSKQISKKGTNPNQHPDKKSGNHKKRHQDLPPDFIKKCNSYLNEFKSLEETKIYSGDVDAHE